MSSIIKSQRSKRRKLNAELSLIQNIYSIEESPIINVDISQIPSSSACIQQSIAAPHQNDPVLLDTSTEATTSLYSTLFNENIRQSSSSVASDDLSENIVNFLSTSNQKMTHENATTKDDCFINNLSLWALECNVSHITLNKLLKLMKGYEVIHTKNLPLDSRTLLSTPKSNNNQIRIVEPGHYYHFGLVQQIQRFAPHDMTEIKLVIGIDGLPIAKSCNNQLWPILAYIVSSEIKKTVFPVGIYYGKSKPNDSNDFLEDFIVEAKELLTNGIDVHGHKKKVFIHAFVCDAPARSYILKIKGHSGYFSCTRCLFEGENCESRVCFPYSNNKSAERTHDMYVNMTNEEHHVGKTTSKLTELPGIDLIQSFPLDYMHLVNLGIVKKLIQLWLFKGPLNVRLPGRSINALSTALLAIQSCIPSDFVRKTRLVQEVSRWKATELRLFILYVGPIVLKNIISSDAYTNFMCLHVAMIILLSPNHQNFLNYARELLEYFVKTFEQIYGSKHCSYNIHALLHICDDYEYYGQLDECSAFVFENYMKHLKSKIRKHEKPLEQIINRYSEMYDKKQPSLLQCPTPNYKLSLPHKCGPLLENICGSQFKKFTTNNTKLNVSNNSDCYILTKSNDVFKCFNFVNTHDNNVVIIGKIFEEKHKFYKKPVESSVFNINIVKNLSRNFIFLDSSEIDFKIMLLNYCNSSIALPVIHTKSKTNC